MGIFARTKVIHEHTHLNATVRGTLHGSKDALCLLITAQCKILDAIATKGWKKTKIRIKRKKWLVAGWNNRL
jgi:hypothetical protein